MQLRERLRSRPGPRAAAPRSCTCGASGSPCGARPGCCTRRRAALAAAAAVAADPLKLAGQSSAVGLNKPRSSSIAGVQFNAQLSLAQQTVPGTSAPMARGGAKSSLVKQSSLTKQHFDINDLASFQQELAAASEAKKKMSLQHQNDTTESADEL